VRVWDWPTGELTWEAGGFQLSPWGHVTAAFAPDGQTLAIGTGGGDVRLWDRDTGRPLARFMRHRGWVRAVAFTPDGRALLSGSDDDTAMIWDLTRPLPGASPPQNRGGTP
jgi:WD40 repeat protein